MSVDKIEFVTPEFALLCPNYTAALSPGTQEKSLCSGLHKRLRKPKHSFQLI